MTECVCVIRIKVSLSSTVIQVSGRSVYQHKHINLLKTTHKICTEDG